jgi:hypothetical protein
MTFKHCAECGEQRIVWDLDEHGKCEGGCAKKTPAPPKKVNGFHVDKSIRNYIGRLQEKYGFTQPEDGSENRYDERRSAQSWLRHTFWWVLHNNVAHPLIGLVPTHATFEFHDWTSRKLHAR